jgi:hypothetical protein
MKRGRDRKHHWSTTQHLEHIRKHPKKWLCSYWRGNSTWSHDVWWRHFRLKGPTWADIAQLLVAHASTPPFQRNSFEVTWSLTTSHPVAMSVMRNGTLCATTIVRKKRGNRWLPVTSLPVAPPCSTSNATLAVLILDRIIGLLRVYIYAWMMPLILYCKWSEEK